MKNDAKFEKGHRKETQNSKEDIKRYKETQEDTKDTKEIQEKDTKRQT